MSRNGSIKMIRFTKEDVVLINKLLTTPYKDDRDAYKSEDSKDLIVHIMAHISGKFLSPGDILLNRSYLFDSFTVEDANRQYGCMHKTCCLAYFAYLCVKHLSLMNADYKPLDMIENRWVNNPEDEELIELIEKVEWYTTDIVDEKMEELVYNYGNKYLPLLGGWCEPYDWVHDYGQHPMTVEMNPTIEWDYEEDED